MENMQYTITLTVYSEEKDKIIQGLKEAMTKVSKDLIEASKYGCEQEKVWELAQLLYKLREAHSHLGFNYDWKPVQENEQI